MTQPNALNQTFDTSLIDTHQQQQLLNRSFSSTETNTSGSNTSNTHHKIPPGEADPSMSAPTQQAGEPFTAVTNAQLYDTWAETYDTDGNVLQAVDDLELETLLPEFVRLVRRNSAGSGSESRKSRILDFGCGTGRNTVKLLQLPWADDQGRGMEVDVHGWDASDAMLALARQKCSAAMATSTSTASSTTRQNVKLVALEQVDFSSPSAISTDRHTSFDAIISTLVLEHLPLDTFFSTLATLLKPGGYALVTNMHPDMGRSTRAGYKTESGERVKGESWVHGVGESVGAATGVGLEVVDIGGAGNGGVGLKEREVDEEMIKRGLVGNRGKKWVGKRVWYGFVVRKR